MQVGMDSVVVALAWTCVHACARNPNIVGQEEKKNNLIKDHIN